jgi:hypothetical protein
MLFSLTRLIELKKLSTTKFYNFSRSTTFIWVICSFDIVIVILFINFTYHFVNNVTVTLLDEEMTKIKVIDLNVL